jgi:L-threonylcarbamoyladenylate synthase
MKKTANIAAEILRNGGVIAYPTEGVFGLGCLPSEELAIKRILTIKNRDESKGLILIASDAKQLDPWIKLPNKTLLPKPIEHCPITWIVPFSKKISKLVTGKNEGVAIRLTTNPIVRSICSRVESAIISTSANLSGQPIVKSQTELKEKFVNLVDFIVPGNCGQASGPSEIRNLMTGKILRNGKK